ncbi:MAG: SPFH domain-containing protein [Candidatus Njordarchaeales archaeon]
MQAGVFFLMSFLFFIFFFLVIYFLSGIRILPEYERAVVFRLGRLVGVKGPGLIWIIPGIDSIQRVDLRVQTIDIPSQELITKDNINIKVDAAVFYRIHDPGKAVVTLGNIQRTIYVLGQTALRDILGDFELDEILTRREELAKRIQELVDEQVSGWGIKVVNVALQQIVLPPELVRAMAAQAEAERERRAKIISAEGDRQAAEIIAKAAEYYEKHPVALRLRELDTLQAMAKEKNVVLLYPLTVGTGFEEILKAIGVTKTLIKKETEEEHESS